MRFHLCGAQYFDTFGVGTLHQSNVELGRRSHGRDPRSVHSPQRVGHHCDSWGQHASDSRNQPDRRIGSAGPFVHLGQSY